MPDPDTKLPGEGDLPPADNKDDGAKGDPPPSGDDTSKLKDALDKERKAAREAQRQAREQAAELEALRKEKAEREDAEKTELQRAEDRAAEAEKQIAERDARIRQHVISTAVLMSASKLNAIDPDAVLALVDRSALTLEDDRVTNADDIVGELLKAKPYLVKPEGNGSGGGVPPPSPKPGEQGLTDQQRRERQEAGLKAAARSF